MNSDDSTTPKMPMGTADDQLNRSSQTDIGSGVKLDMPASTGVGQSLQDIYVGSGARAGDTRTAVYRPDLSADMNSPETASATSAAAQPGYAEQTRSVMETPARVGRHTSLPVTATAAPIEADPSAQLLKNIWAARGPILGATLLATAAGYGLSFLQKPVYVSTASLVSTAAGSGDLVNSSVVKAPVLPSGAVNQALQGPELTNNLMARVTKSALPENIKQDILASLQAHLNGDDERVVWVEGFEGDKMNDGLYTVSGQARTGVGARALTNLAAQTILAWDVERAQERLAQARTSIQGQLKALEADTPNNDLYDEAHSTARSRLLQNLAVTGAARESAVGTLELVSEAVEPLKPDSPKPVRQALLAGLLTLLVAAGLFGTGVLGRRRA